MIHTSYTSVKIINLTSSVRSRFNRYEMTVASSLRTVVVPVEIVALSARRISFIRREPCSG
jgi:hypothetical protein